MSAEAQKAERRNRHSSRHLHLLLASKIWRCWQHGFAAQPRSSNSAWATIDHKWLAILLHCVWDQPAFFHFWLLLIGRVLKCGTTEVALFPGLKGARDLHYVSSRIPLGTFAALSNNSAFALIRGTYSVLTPKQFRGRAPWGTYSDVPQLKKGALTPQLHPPISHRDLWIRWRIAPESRSCGSADQGDPLESVLLYPVLTRTWA